jgi:hypothetical protein
MKPLVPLFVVFVLLVSPQSRAMTDQPSTLAGQNSTGASTGKGRSAAAEITPSPGATLSPRPPGQRDPVVGVLAVAAILVAGGAGLFIYLVIRKGL